MLSPPFSIEPNDHKHVYQTILFFAFFELETWNYKLFVVYLQQIMTKNNMSNQEPGYVYIDAKTKVKVLDEIRKEKESLETIKVTCYGKQTEA